MIRRFLRFLWLLARGPLRLLAGVAGGCAVLAGLYGLGRLVGIPHPLGALGMGVLCIWAGIGLVGCLFGGAALAVRAVEWVKAAWQEAKSS